MTGVTNRQIEQLEIAQYTPMHPEDELKKRGVKYECEHANPEVYASYLSIDGNFIKICKFQKKCQNQKLSKAFLISKKIKISVHAFIYKIIFMTIKNIMCLGIIFR